MKRHNQTANDAPPKRATNFCPNPRKKAAQSHFFSSLLGKDAKPILQSRHTISRPQRVISHHILLRVDSQFCGVLNV
jgi:hypothetical protein